jgi:hypothetical protein
LQFYDIKRIDVCCATAIATKRKLVVLVQPKLIFPLSCLLSTRMVAKAFSHPIDKQYITTLACQ